MSDMNIKASAWELLAFTFRYPTTELAEVAASGEWAEAVEEVAEALGVKLPESFAADARACAGEDPEALLHVLRTDATRLFIGTPEAVVSPFEGVNRAIEDGVQPLMFVNPHSMAVERFCRSCGLGRPEGTNEPLDHVATECELLEYLAAVSCGLMSASAEAPAAEDMPGGSYEAAYEQFIAEHAAVWMPRFAEKTAAEARQPLYRAAAAFMSAVLEACA